MISRGELGCMAAWHLPGGPVGPASRWAATSNVEVGLTTYPVDRGRVSEGRGKKGARDKVTKRRRNKEGWERERKRTQGPLATEVGLYLDIFAAPPSPEFLVMPLLMGSVSLLSQDRFEEPVRPWLYPISFINGKEKVRSNPTIPIPQFIDFISSFLRSTEDSSLQLPHSWLSAVPVKRLVITRHFNGFCYSLTNFPSFDSSHFYRSSDIYCG